MNNLFETARKPTDLRLLLPGGGVITPIRYHVSRPAPLPIQQRGRLDLADDIVQGSFECWPFEGCHLGHPLWAMAIFLSSQNDIEIAPVTLYELGLRVDGATELAVIHGRYCTLQAPIPFADPALALEALVFELDLAPTDNCSPEQFLEQNARRQVYADWLRGHNLDYWSDLVSPGAPLSGWDELAEPEDPFSE